MLFKTLSNEKIARNLCEVIYLSNRDNIECGQSIDQVYGAAYKSLENLLIHIFGVRVTKLAMNNSTWCCSDFDGQIVPAIEWAIEEAAIDVKLDRAKKMVEFLNDNTTPEWQFDCFRHDEFIACYYEDEIKEPIEIDWNVVHEWVENH